MAGKQTQFESGPRGFRFYNSFDLLPKTKLPKLGRLDLDSFTVIGLCGGMCFLALDHFYAGKPVPEIAEVHKIEPELLAALRQRQSDSVSGKVLVKLARWMLSSDRQVARMTAYQEVPRLTALLDAGHPAVLLLVRTQGLENPTLNHQVVATGYAYDADTKDLRIALYDPNHPGQVPELRMNLANPDDGIGLTQTTGEPRRGFFVQKYEKKGIGNRD